MLNDECGILNYRNRQQLAVREDLINSEHSKFNIRQIHQAMAAVTLIDG
jgi:hypothetical protein